MRRVRWSAQADRSLAQVFDYLADRDLAAAHRITNEIVDAGNALGLYSTGRPGPVPRTYLKSLTALDYILYYRIDGADELTILEVVHTRRDWVPGQLPPKSR